MADAMGMMAKQLFKALGLNADEVFGQITEMRNLFVEGFKHAQQANRRLARIEAHLGLSDIEPIHNEMVITHDPTSSNGNEPLRAGSDGPR